MADVRPCFLAILTCLVVLAAGDASAAVGGWIQSTRKLRERLQSDPHRPGYHIVTPEGLCGPFDPNGALFWKGRYHLMYIVQTPKGHCWAHISSHDLVHWRHHPLALEPGGVDNGIFSGGAFQSPTHLPYLELEPVCRIAGDIAPESIDCVVDALDLEELANAWLATSDPTPSANWNPRADLVPDANGVINFFDYCILAENWLESAP